MDYHLIFHLLHRVPLLPFRVSLLQTGLSPTSLPQHRQSHLPKNQCPSWHHSAPESTLHLLTLQFKLPTKPLPHAGWSSHGPASSTLTPPFNPDLLLLLPFLPPGANILLRGHGHLPWDVSSVGSPPWHTGTAHLSNCHMLPQQHHLALGEHSTGTHHGFSVSALAWIILRWGVCPVCCRMFSRHLSLYPLDTSSCTYYPQMSPHAAKCPLGAKLPQVENHWDIFISSNKPSTPGEQGPCYFSVISSQNLAHAVNTCQSEYMNEYMTRHTAGQWCRIAFSTGQPMSPGKPGLGYIHQVPYGPHYSISKNQIFWITVSPVNFSQ